MSHRKQIWIARLLLMCIPAGFLYSMSQITLHSRGNDTWWPFRHIHNVLQPIAAICIWVSLTIVAVFLGITVLVNGLALVGWFTQWIIKAGAGKPDLITSWDSWRWPGWPIEIKSKPVSGDLDD